MTRACTHVSKCRTHKLSECTGQESSESESELLAGNSRSRALWGNFVTSTPASSCSVFVLTSPSVCSSCLSGICRPMRWAATHNRFVQLPTDTRTCNGKKRRTANTHTHTHTHTHTQCVRKHNSTKMETDRHFEAFGQGVKRLGSFGVFS